MRTRLYFFSVLIISLLLVVPVRNAFGQATTGNITGTVVDPTGAAVSDAQVMVTNVATGITTTAESNQSGIYSVTHLLPGTYTVTVSKQGFRALVQKNVTVAVGLSTAVDVRLQLGSISQHITVSSAPPLIVTDSAQVTSRLSSPVIESIPIYGLRP